MTLDTRPRVQSVYGGTAVSRRRAMTIVAAAAGMPLLCGADRSPSAPLLHQWTGTSLGSPSQLLLYHRRRRDGGPDRTVNAPRKSSGWSASLRSIKPTARSLGSTVTAALSFPSTRSAHGAFAMPDLVRAQRGRV